MKTNKLVVALLMLLSIGISSCQKPEKGEKGDAGPAGQNGNANVVNYDIVIYPSQWVYDATYERMFKNFVCYEDFQSAVYAYVMSGSGEQAMPYYSATSAWSEQYDMANALFQSVPYIQFQYTNYNDRTSPPSAAEHFYLVIIPPSRQSEHPDLDYTSYQEVKKAFNLGEPVKIIAGVNSAIK